MSHSTCRGCGQIIEWVKTRAGKNMPVDPEPVDWDDAEDGDVLVDQTGWTVKKGSTEVLGPAAHEWRVSHFATCPKADNFRKEK